jgi:hypothetical protein
LGTPGEPSPQKETNLTISRNQKVGKRNRRGQKVQSWMGRKVAPPLSPSLCVCLWQHDNDGNGRGMMEIPAQME